MNWLSKIPQPFFYLLLVLAAALTFLLSDRKISDLLINLSASLIILIITLLFIDKYFGQWKVKEKQLIKKSFLADLQQAYANFFLFAAHVFKIDEEYFFDLILNKRSKVELIDYLEFLNVLETVVEETDFTLWSSNEIKKVNELLSILKTSLGDIEHYYTYDVISVALLGKVLDLKKNSVLFFPLNLYIDNKLIKEKLAYNEIVKKNFKIILDGLRTIVNEFD